MRSVGYRPVVKRSTSFRISSNAIIVVVILVEKIGDCRAVRIGIGETGINTSTAQGISTAGCSGGLGSMVSFYWDVHLVFFICFRLGITPGMIIHPYARMSFSDHVVAFPTGKPNTAFSNVRFTRNTSRKDYPSRLDAEDPDPLWLCIKHRSMMPATFVCLRLLNC